MPQVNEIPPASSRNPFADILNMLEIPQVISKTKPKFANSDPEAAKGEALQPPRVDPIMTAANVMSGGVATPAGIFSKILTDIALQHGISSVSPSTKRAYTRNTGDPFPSVPPGYQEGYYPPGKYAAPRSIIPSKETGNFIRPVTFDEDNGSIKRGVTKELGWQKPSDLPNAPRSFKEGLPDYAKITAEDSYFGKPFIENLVSHGEEGPPDPTKLLWHAIGLEPDMILPSIAKKIQKEGLSAGWFSEQPGHNFGPIRLGAKPEDLPPMKPRIRALREDPEVELIPKWSSKSKYEDQPLDEKQLGSQEYTTNRGDFTPISVHPSKFTVIDSEGNLLGKLAEQRAGEKATTSLSAQMFKQLLEEAE